MARIPTVEALGEANVQATRGVTNYAPAVQGFGAEREEAAALGGIGKQIGHIGAEFEKRVNEEELYRQQARLSMFDLDQERRLDEEKRNIAPGGEGFAAGYKNQYDAAARGFMQDVPEQHKARVDAMLAKRADHWVQQANRTELAERDRFHLEAVNRDLTTLLNDTTAAPERWQSNVERGLPIIDSSKMAPRAKAIARQKFLEGNDEAAVRSLIDRSINDNVDVGPLIDRIRKAPKGSLLPGESKSGSIKNDGNMAVVSAGSGANFRVATPHAEQFAGLVRDLEAEGIVIKPEESGGYNPRNIAGTNIRSKHADGLAVDINWGENPRGGKSAIIDMVGADKIREIAAKHGLKWGGDFRNNPDPMHFEVDPGGVERKPLSERGLTRYAGMKAPKTTDAVDDNDPGTIDPKADTVGGPADPMDAPVEADDAEFRNLRPEVRRKLINVARTAQRAWADKKIDDAVADIKAGREPKSADGIAEYEKMLPHLTAHQRRAAEEKIYYAKSFSEMTRDMHDLSRDEIEDKIERLAARTDIPEGQVAAHQKAVSDAVRKYKAIEGLREKDPVRAVQGDLGLGVRPAQEIIDLKANVGRGQSPSEVWAKTFEARLTAQQRLAPDKPPRLLSKGEADKLLMIPAGVTDPSSPAFRNAVKQAADTAMTRYGPEWAERAVKDAIAQKIRNEDASKMATGQALRQIRSGLDAQRELDREARRGRARSEMPDFQVMQPQARPSPAAPLPRVAPKPVKPGSNPFDQFDNR